MPTTQLSRLPSAGTSVHPSAIARRLATVSLWDAIVEFDPSERWYTRIARERNWEAWLLSWLPGQHTPWHDHGGSSGALVVLRGRLSEATAVEPDRFGARRDGQVRELRHGDLRAFGPRHLHRLDNLGSEPAVSLHVYAPGLREMNDYELADDQVTLRRVGARRAGTGW